MPCCCFGTDKKKFLEHNDTLRTDRKCWGALLPISAALVIIGIISLSGLKFLPQAASIAMIAAPSFFIIIFLCKRHRDSGFGIKPFWKRGGVAAVQPGTSKNAVIPASHHGPQRPPEPTNQMGQHTLKKGFVMHDAALHMMDDYR